MTPKELKEKLAGEKAVFVGFRKGVLEFRLVDESLECDIVVCDFRARMFGMVFEAGKEYVVRDLDIDRVHVKSCQWVPVGG